MHTSVSLVNVICNIFWVVATSLTTSDSLGSARELLLAKHSQAYFDAASELHRSLLVLESIDQVIHYVDVDFVLSDLFGDWLSRSRFNRFHGISRDDLSSPDDLLQLFVVLGNPQGPALEVCTNQLKQLKEQLGLGQKSPATKADAAARLQQLKNSINNSTNSQEAAAQLSADALLALVAIYRSCIQLSRQLILATAKARLDEETRNLQRYNSDYQDAVLRVVGQQVRKVAKPTWKDLSRSTRLTLFCLADTNGCQAEQADIDCFDAARREFRTLTQAA